LGIFNDHLLLFLLKLIGWIFLHFVCFMWSLWIYFPILVCSTKKNFATRHAPYTLPEFLLTAITCLSNCVANWWLQKGLFITRNTNFVPDYKNWGSSILSS
jgi:hypothetical protein